MFEPEQPASTLSCVTRSKIPHLLYPLNCKMKRTVMGLLWIYLDIYIQISVIVLKTHWRAQVSYVLSPCKRGTAAPRASTRSFLLPRTTPGSPRPQGLSTTPQCTEAPCCTDAPTVMVTCHFPPLIVSPGEATAPEGKGRALPEESG